MRINRDVYLHRLIDRKHDGMVKIITGIRGAGKSYLMNTLFYEHLLSSGIDSEHIIKFAFDSFDDLRMIGEDSSVLSRPGRRVPAAEKFADFLSSRMQGGGMYYLLLDDVRMLDGFEFVLNGYLRRDNVDIYVTGSNSRFLSTDIVTEFRGRGDVIHVLPLSFSEFFSVYGGTADKALDDYLVYGGLPQVALASGSEQKTSFLDYQLKNIYLRDIADRHNLSSDDDMGNLLDVLASDVSSLVNPRKLCDTFRTVKNSRISEQTIASYVSYLEDAFVIDRAYRYDIKGRRYIGTPYKIYFEDNGLRNARVSFNQTENTRLMENAIYNELRYRGFGVSVGVVEKRERDTTGKETRNRLEIDFVATKGDKRYYVQSAYGAATPEKLARETRPFDRVDDSFKKIVVVGETMKPRTDGKGYVVMGVKEFLLDRDSLDA